MDTLYELLGALPHDDAEALRSAFRKAVKGAHPDIRPGDPDAALRFRQIIRANEILTDKDQRAAYDHLLMLAQIEKDPASAHPIAARIHKIASGALALASASIVTAGGYFVFMHMSLAALVAPVGSLAASSNPPSIADLTTRLTASIAAVSPTDAPDPAAVSAFIAKAEGAIAKAEVTSATATVAASAAPSTETANTSSPSMALPDPAPAYANFFQAHSASRYANANVNGAIADPGPVAQLDTKFTTSYADRGILFFREKKDEHGFPELSPVKRAEKPAHPKSVVTATAKMHAEAPKAVPLPQPRTAPRFYSPLQQPPQQPSIAYATFQ